MLDKAPRNIPEEETEKFVPFKDLKTHKDFGKFSFSKDEPYGVHNQNELYQSGGNNDYIIRALGGNRPEVIINIETNEQLVKATKELKQKYSELEQLFGITVAPTTFVPAKSATGFPEIWAITEKVSGINLDKITAEEFPAFQEKLMPVLIAHFENLLRYLEEKYKEKKRFMADIFNNEQYVYGKVKSDAEEKLYLVDPEPQYLELGDMDEDKFWTQYLTSFHNLLCIVHELEEKWKLPKSVFVGVKEKFRKHYPRILAIAPESCNRPYHDARKKTIEELLEVW